MFVLVTSTHVKPNADDAFAEVFEKTLLPSLRAQPGFRDEMLFIVAGCFKSSTNSPPSGVTSNP